MTSHASYSEEGVKVFMTIRLEQLSWEERANLLWDLLNLFDPGQGKDGYKNYQMATSVILQRVDRVVEEGA